MTTFEAGLPGAGLLIGDLARLCGVSTRAVRHYHAAGLLPEPARDSSGYRRYGMADVIALVRIARLRALGMPVPQIAERVSSGAPGFAADDLRTLAAELDVEIGRLSNLRDRIVAAVGSQTIGDPAETLAAALREYGRLGTGDELPRTEVEAAKLVDALHPGGLVGALDAAQDLLNPSALATFDALLQRYRGLGPTSTPEQIEGLATDVAAAIPRPPNAPATVDVAVMDKLLGDRLNDAQRQFMFRLRQVLDGSDE